MIQLEHITKTYEKQGTVVRALEDVNLHVPKGGFLAITGPSGSGKTTLMNLLGCLDRPTGGRYLLEGVPVGALGSSAAAHIRNRKIGFVFQNFNLIGSSLMATACGSLLTTSGGYSAPFALLLGLSVGALVLNLLIKKP